MERNTRGRKAMPPRQTDDFSQTIRSMIDSENALVNHRVGWLTTLQGLLFAALGVAWDKPTAASLVPIFCVLGIGTAVIVSLALIGATRAQVQLITWWDQHKPTQYAGPDEVGLRPHPSRVSHFRTMELACCAIRCRMVCSSRREVFGLRCVPKQCIDGADPLANAKSVTNRLSVGMDGSGWERDSHSFFPICGSVRTMGQPFVFLLLVNDRKDMTWVDVSSRFC